MGAQDELREAWKRRPNGDADIFGNENDLYWIQISDRTIAMDTEVTETKGDDAKDDAEAKDASKEINGDSSNIFTGLSPHKAYGLVNKHIKPIKGSTYRNTDGSYSTQIFKCEVNIAVNIYMFSEYPVLIEEHPYKNRCRGKAYHPDTKLMPEEEMLEALQDYNVTKIIKKTRYNKDKKSKELSGEIILHFNSQVPPSEVDLDYLKLKIEPFVPQPPLCYKCFEIGSHIEDNCNQVVAICGWCTNAKSMHEENVDKCNKPPKCRNCEGNHPAWDKKCPNYEFLKKVYALKEAKKIPFARAKALCKQNTSYANKAKVSEVVAQTNISSMGAETKLRELIDQSNKAWENRMAEFENRMEQQLINMTHLFQQRLENMFERLSSFMMKTVNQSVPLNGPITLPTSFYGTQHLSSPGQPAGSAHHYSVSYPQYPKSTDDDRLMDADISYANKDQCTKSPNFKKTKINKHFT